MRSKLKLFKVRLNVTILSPKQADYTDEGPDGTFIGIQGDFYTHMMNKLNLEYVQLAVTLCAVTSSILHSARMQEVELREEFGHCDELNKCTGTLGAAMNQVS